MGVGTYVRYWDGRTVAYGQIAAVKDKTFVVRVGGTEDTNVEVGKAMVTYHPTVIAMGQTRAKDTVALSKGNYLYHATASTNVALIKNTGLKPRSMLSMQDLAWKGAEVESGRTEPTDPIRDHYEAAQKVNLSDPSMEKRIDWILAMFYFGDVGEYVYATPSLRTVAGYALQVLQKGKTPVILRFKAGNDKWYQDAKENAVMGMTVIPSGSMEKHQIEYNPSQEVANDSSEEDFHRTMIEGELEEAIWQAL